MTTPPPPPPHEPAKGPRRRPGRRTEPQTGAIPQHPQPKPRRRPSLRGEQPTETIPLRGSLRGTPYRDPRVTRAVAEERAAAHAMDLALRVAEIMLRSGSSAAGVESATIAVGVAAGLDDLDVDLTMQSMHLQCRTPSGQTISRLRVVRQPRLDFARLAMVHALVDDLVSGDIDLEQADSQLREISRAPRMWSRWFVTLAEGGVAGGVALLLGASLPGVLVAAAAACVTILLSGLVDRLSLPDFYLGALGGATATLIAFFAYVLGTYGIIPISPADFAFIVAGGIVALLPSRTLISAMEDVLSGFPVTGTARLFAVMLHTFGLIVGVASGLGLCLQAGGLLGIELTPPPLDKLAWASGPLPMVIIGAVVIGLTGAITLQDSRRMLLPASLLCVSGVAVAVGLSSLGIGRVTSTGLAAAVIGFLARYIALRMDAPALTISVPASFGLYPGLGIFIGLYHMSSPATVADGANSTAGLFNVLGAFGVIMAIATGNTLGDRLAAPFDAPVAQRRRATVEQEGDRRAEDGWDIV
ncbi:MULTISPECIES: threonine/serine ThrE exporter family protein [Janibacter]|uniref:threonine/serine ThrE exporter family protein n=1 Tax=Janibacter TaxID=53457 RepID=UPI0021A78232|nr:threonine/serine exporter family protein [Janibacter hoylei]MCT2293929.1 threonine/serine exporter family protein [Janibacter hoylei]